MQEKVEPSNPEYSSGRLYHYNHGSSKENYTRGVRRSSQDLHDIEKRESRVAVEQLQNNNAGNTSRIDAEVAKYASNVKVHISEEESRRLRKMIDIRILTVMVFVSSNSRHTPPVRWPDMFLYILPPGLGQGCDGLRVNHAYARRSASQRATGDCLLLVDQNTF
jgi:hypothetical protein